MQQALTTGSGGTMSLQQKQYLQVSGGTISLHQKQYLQVGVDTVSCGSYAKIDRVYEGRLNIYGVKLFTQCAMLKIQMKSMSFQER